MKRVRGCVAAAGAMMLASQAWEGSAVAAGFATQTFGGEHGNVVETNPTALYYNPGSLGFSTDTGLGVYGSLALHSVTWTHSKAVDDYADPATAAVAASADTGKASLLNVFGGASIAGSTHLTKNLVIGAGVFSPFYGLAHWNKNDSFSGTAQFPLANAGVQRWFAIDGKMEVLYFSAGAAYRLGPVSVGATGNFISTTVSNYQARNSIGNGFPDVGNEGRSYFDVQGYSGSFAAGLMAEVLPEQLWLAASYQAQPSMGGQSIDGDLLVTGADGKKTHWDVTFHQSLPDIVRAGARFRPRKLPWEFRVFGDYTRWSHFDRQCLAQKGASCAVNPTTGGQLPPPGGAVFASIQRNWRDTFGLRVGASYWVQPAIEVFAGGGYEIAASPDSTIAPDLPDADNFQATIGGRFALTEYLFFSASYTHIQYLNRNVPDSASILASQNGSMLRYPTVEGNGGGLYTQWADILTGNLEALF